MSITTIADVRERCIVEPVTGCWIWTGAGANRGSPKIHTFNHATGEKHTLSGALAVWNIAFSKAPRPGLMVFRCCQRNLCISPYHLREGTPADVGVYIKRTGSRKGTAIEARTANAAKARAAKGLEPLPDAIVDAVRNAPPELSGREIGALHGITKGQANRIRRGATYRVSVLA